MLNGQVADENIYQLGQEQLIPEAIPRVPFKCMQMFARMIAGIPNV
jgi:hypothetical protein